VEGRSAEEGERERKEARKENGRDGMK